MRNWITGAALALSLGAAQAAIKEQPVTYKGGDTTMKRFVVYDDASNAKRPGVIVVHEWWGITKHVRDEARKLAGQGYTAFVADMYGDGKTADNPKDAGALLGWVRKNPAAMQSRFSWGSPIRSSCSTTAGSSPRGRPARSRATRKSSGPTSGAPDAQA